MDNISGRIQRNRTEQMIGYLTPRNKNVEGTLNTMRVYPITKTQEKTAISSLVDQEVRPDENFTLSKVKIQALPVNREINEKGGYTVTIGV